MGSERRVGMLRTYRQRSSPFSGPTTTSEISISGIEVSRQLFASLIEATHATVKPCSKPVASVLAYLDHFLQREFVTYPRLTTHIYSRAIQTIIKRKKIHTSSLQKNLAKNLSSLSS